MSDLIKQLMEPGIIPVFYHPDSGYCQEIFDLSVAAGITAFEFTNRGANALANFKVLKAYRDQFAPAMLLGIGTVFSDADAEAFINAGADFIVSPCMVERVALFCRSKNVLYIPGCMTVKEVLHAQEIGCMMVKIFPADVLGVSFVQSVKAVLPAVRLMVTGGIRPEKAVIHAWRKAGADAIGLGSALFANEPGKVHQQTVIQQRLKTLILAD
jgi:2-dehydro-3-deoxyphosphogluconate aldolase/(4S)-4-hydroxy-2-oxoglutarate aldolase